MVAIKELLTLAEATEAPGTVKVPGYGYVDLKAVRAIEAAIFEAIAPIIADAQRYRSLQGKIDGASEPQ